MKTCTRCGEDKALTEFYQRKERPGQHFSHCKSCVVEKRMVNYEDNKERDKQTAKQTRERNKAEIDAHKTPCPICGESRLPCLDLHHIDQTEKEFHPSSLIGKSRAVRQAELAKCISLCSNCHRVFHAGDELTIRKVGLAVEHRRAEGVTTSRERVA